MSKALSIVGGLRTWTEQEIFLRDHAISLISKNMEARMRDLNAAWRFMRVETPVIIPRGDINAAYDVDDFFSIENVIADENIALRPETTKGSYLAAIDIMQSGEAKLPLCVWQAGLSFRTETNDGATAAKLRFNQFWQLEFQMLYSDTTHADVPAVARRAAYDAIRLFLGNAACTTETSDRLPAYSRETIDIMAPWYGGADGMRSMMEVASTSRRMDFEMKGRTGIACLEIAIGLDRLVAIKVGRA